MGIIYQMFVQKCGCNLFLVHVEAYTTLIVVTFFHDFLPLSPQFEIHSLLQPQLLIPDSTDKHMVSPEACHVKCGAPYHAAVPSSSMHRHHLVEDTSCAA